MEMEKRKMNGTANLFSLVERIQKLESENKFLKPSSSRSYLHGQFIYGLWASCFFLLVVRTKNNYSKPPAHSWLLSLLLIQLSIVKEGRELQQNAESQIWKKKKLQRPM